MKKISLALMIGIFAIGCGEAVKPIQQDPIDMKKMQAHMPPPPGGAKSAPAADAKPDAAADGDKSEKTEKPAEAPAGDAAPK